MNNTQLWHIHKNEFLQFVLNTIPEGNYKELKKLEKTVIKLEEEGLTIVEILVELKKIYEENDNE
jgi:hypothetical protein